MIGALLLLASLPDAATVDARGAPPIVARRNALGHLKASVRRKIEPRFDATGILVDTRTEPVASGGPPCGANRIDPYPFDAIEPDVSDCSGYFVDEGLFLTAAHCMCNGAAMHFKVGRGHYEPNAPIQAQPISGVVVPDLDQIGDQWDTDWMFLKTRSNALDGLERWAKGPEAEPSPSQGDLLYLISSPLGFSLHLTTGPLLGNGKHGVPAWPDSSGAPLFDLNTHALIGVHTREKPSTGYTCQCPSEFDGEAKPPCDQCTAIIPNPTNVRTMTGRFVPIGHIRGAIEDKHYEVLNVLSRDFREFCAKRESADKLFPSSTPNCTGCHCRTDAPTRRSPGGAGEDAGSAGP